MNTVMSDSHGKSICSLLLPLDEFEAQMNAIIHSYSEPHNKSQSIGFDKVREQELKKILVNLYMDSVGQGFCDPKQKSKIRAAVYKVFDEKINAIYNNKESDGMAMGCLKAFYAIAALFSSMKGRTIYTSLSEEEMGIDLAVVGIQIDYLLERCNMAEEMVEVVQNGFREFIVNYMDAQDRGWQQAVANDKYGLIQPQRVDQETVILLYNYLTKKYVKTQDFQEVLKAGAKFALETFEKKYHSDSFQRNRRYSSKNHKDLIQFFNKHIYEMNNYVEESSTYEKYIAVFESFCAAIEAKDYASIEFGFIPWGMKEANPQGTKSCLDSIA